jgi:hypothetical protein
MVSLWNRHKDDSDREGSRTREDQGSVGQYHEPQYREPDERTRLLPRDNPAYLSPDDPAVSCTLDYTSNEQTQAKNNIPLIDLVNTRSPPIISGASELFEASLLFSSCLVSSGGRFCSSPSSSARQ